MFPLSPDFLLLCALCVAVIAFKYTEGQGGWVGFLLSVFFFKCYIVYGCHEWVITLLHLSFFFSTWNKIRHMLEFILLFLHSFQTKLVQNQPYDESLDINDSEDVASIHSPTPRKPGEKKLGQNENYGNCLRGQIACLPSLIIFFYFTSS